jgi:hypothetical protein
VIDDLQVAALLDALAQGAARCSGIQQPPYLPACSHRVRIMGGELQVGAGQPAGSQQGPAIVVRGPEGAVQPRAAGDAGAGRRRPNPPPASPSPPTPHPHPPNPAVQPRGAGGG